MTDQAIAARLRIVRLLHIGFAVCCLAIVFVAGSPEDTNHTIGAFGFEANANQFLRAGSVVAVSLMLLLVSHLACVNRLLTADPDCTAQITPVPWIAFDGGAWGWVTAILFFAVLPGISTCVAYVLRFELKGSVLSITYDVPAVVLTIASFLGVYAVILIHRISKRVPV